MSETPDALSTERAAYLVASQASLDATLDAVSIQREPPSADQAARFMATLRAMAAHQVETLAAHDRLMQRAAQLGANRAVINQLREFRVDLAVALQRTVEQVSWLRQEC